MTRLSIVKSDHIGDRPSHSDDPYPNPKSISTDISCTDAGIPSPSPNPPPPPPAASTPPVPYVKGPIFVDYGLRVHIDPTTFINRNCFILDTPVADITIGPRCAIGPNVTIVGVGHPARHEDRCEAETGRPGSWGAAVALGAGVWIGAGVTIL